MSEHKNCCLFDNEIKLCWSCKQRSKVPRTGLCAISELKAKKIRHQAKFSAVLFADILFADILSDKI